MDMYSDDGKKSNRGNNIEKQRWEDKLLNSYHMIAHKVHWVDGLKLNLGQLPEQETF